MFVLGATSKKSVSVLEFVLQRNFGGKEEEILQKKENRKDTRLHLYLKSVISNHHFMAN